MPKFQLHYPPQFWTDNFRPNFEYFLATPSQIKTQYQTNQRGGLANQIMFFFPFTRHSLLFLFRCELAEQTRQSWCVI